MKPAESHPGKMSPISERYYGGVGQHSDLDRPPQARSVFWCDFGKHDECLDFQANVFILAGGGIGP